MRVLLAALVAASASAGGAAAESQPGLGKAMNFFTAMKRDAEKEHTKNEKALKELKCKCATDKKDTEERIKELEQEVAAGEKTVATLKADLVKFEAKKQGAIRAKSEDAPEAGFTEADLTSKQQEVAECKEGQQQPLFEAKTALKAKMKELPTIASAHQVVKQLHDQVVETCEGLEQEAEKLQKYLIEYNDEVAAFTQASAQKITDLSERVLTLKTDLHDEEKNLENAGEELGIEKEKKVALDRDCEESLQLNAELVLKAAQKKEGLSAIVNIFKGNAPKKAFLQKQP